MKKIDSIILNQRQLALIIGFITFIYPILGLIALLLLIFLNTLNYKKVNLAVEISFTFGLIFAAFGLVLYTYNTDLYKYINYVNQSIGSSFSQIVDMNNADYSNLYFFDFLIYWASKTGNAYMLPWLIGLIDYWIIYYIIIDYNRRKGPVANRNLVALLILVISIVSPYSVISNLRCVTSYILISFAAYREWIQNKKDFWNIILYICALLLHTSAIVVLVVKLFSFTLKYFKKAIIVIPVLIPILINFLHDLLQNFSNLGFITAAINKAYIYLSWTEGGFADQISNDSLNLFTRVYGIFFLVLLIVIIFRQKHFFNNYKITFNEKMYNYILFLSLIALGTLSIKTGAFWRYEAIVLFLTPIILIDSFTKNKDLICKYLTNILLICSILSGVIVYRFFIGDLIRINIFNNFVSVNGFEILKSIFKVF